MAESNQELLGVMSVPFHGGPFEVEDGGTPGSLAAAAVAAAAAEAEALAAAESQASGDVVASSSGYGANVATGLSILTDNDEGSPPPPARAVGFMPTSEELQSAVRVFPM